MSANVAAHEAQKELYVCNSYVQRIDRSSINSTLHTLFTITNDKRVICKTKHNFCNPEAIVSF